MGRCSDCGDEIEDQRFGARCGECTAKADQALLSQTAALASDVERESERSVKVACPGCVTRYGGNGLPDKDCPQCNGSGTASFGIVERVWRKS